jgi:hypothetical protein
MPGPRPNTLWLAASGGNGDAHGVLARFRLNADASVLGSILN